MRKPSLVVVAPALAALLLCAATSVRGLESRTFQIREDYTYDLIDECTFQYYYYIPCLSGGASWFNGIRGWEQGQVVGTWFQVGDPSMGINHCPSYPSCDSTVTQSINRFRVLDFAGYGTVYPGLYTIRFDVWCCDELGCPVGAPLWSSGATEFCQYGWNYVNVDPALSVAGCSPGPGACPRFLITATHVGTDAKYPWWGFDDVSDPIADGCDMHDVGCYPALYPRPAVSHYSTMHSGDYGVDFAQCPPSWFADSGDTTGNLYGYMELAWRVYFLATPYYDISGAVRDVIGRPVAGVTMTLAGGAGGSTATDSAGAYTFYELPGGVQYTVTPGKTGCTFSPAARTYQSLSADQVSQDYTGDCTAGHEIAGYVRDQDGIAMPGVALVLSGGAAGSTATDDQGLYVFWDLAGGLAYTITPGKADCYFFPESRTYTNLGGNMFSQNYKGYCGTAGVPDVRPTTWGTIKARFK